MTSDAWERMRQLLGEPCLRYVLALPLEDDVVPGPPATLSTEQSAVLAVLVRMLPPHAAAADVVSVGTAPAGTTTTDTATTNTSGFSSGVDRGMQARFALAWQLGLHVPAMGGSRGVVFRTALGGPVEDLHSEDPVLEMLLPQLRDLYPVMLIPPAMPMLGPDIGAASFHHPLRQPFQDSVMADPHLQRLFPDAGDAAGRRGSYLGPSQGGGIQLSMFADQLLRNAYDRARLEAGVPSLSGVADALVANLDLLRRAVRGETVEVPARVGITGALAPNDLSVFEVGGIRLRARETRDDWLLARAGGRGDRTMRLTQPDGQTIEMNYAGDIIVETTMQYRIQLGEMPPGQWPEHLQTLRQSLHESIESMRLGLVLADSTGDPTLVLPSWVATFDLLGHGPNVSGWEVERNRKLAPRQLDSDQVKEWDTWVRILDARDMSKVVIAVRRVLQAATERDMPEDVLIDSVMVWENLFGAATETNLRVCGSMAWILSSEVEPRKALLKELKDIYSLRSRVVHGSGGLLPKEYAAPQRALRLALDGLRAVLEHRPDLLAERDGNARSNRVLMGD